MRGADWFGPTVKLGDVVHGGDREDERVRCGQRTASLTVTVMVEVPFWFAAGVATQRSAGCPVAPGT